MDERVVNLYLLLGLTSFVFILVAANIEINYKPLRRLRCHLGWHKRKIKVDKRTVRKYHCQICRKPSKQQLTIIDGGNKKVAPKFDF